MVPGLRVQLQSLLSRRACAFGLMAGALAVLSACSAVSELVNATSPSASQQPQPGAPQAPGEIGTTGGVRVGLILPLSAGGMAGHRKESLPGERRGINPNSPFLRRQRELPVDRRLPPALRVAAQVIAEELLPEIAPKC